MYNPIWFLISEGHLAQNMVDHKGSPFSEEIGGGRMVKVAGHRYKANIKIERNQTQWPEVNREHMGYLSFESSQRILLSIIT